MAKLLTFTKDELAKLLNDWKIMNNPLKADPNAQGTNKDAYLKLEN